MANLEQNTISAEAEQTDLQAPSVQAEQAKSTSGTTSQTMSDCVSEPTEKVQDQFSYEEVTWPEDISFDPAQTEAFKTLAHELKLSAEQVQKLVDFETQTARQNATQEADEKRQTLAAWAQQTKTLYGAHLEEEIAYALRAADTFGGPDFRALLEDTGLGNHPVMIRTLIGIGRSISEDFCPGGKPSAPQDKTFAEALYGKQ